MTLIRNMLARSGVVIRALWNGTAYVYKDGTVVTAANLPSGTSISFCDGPDPVNLGLTRD